MTQFAQPYAPQFPQQGFVPQQQYPAAPQYPQSPQYGFAPGYPQPQMAPPPPPLVQGTLEDFYNQRGGGDRGPAWKFTNIGDTHVGIVSRGITSSDVKQQTTPPNQGSQPKFFKDGRPMFELRVPLLVAATAEYPDATATYYVRGQHADELTRAMAEAGAPEGPPEEGALIWSQHNALKQPRGGSGFPAKLVKIVYQRPGTFDPAQYGITGQAIPQPAAQAVPVQQYAQQFMGQHEPAQAPQSVAPPQPVQYAPPVAQPAPVQQPLPAAPVAQAAPAAAPAGLPQRPPNLSDEQWAKLLELQGHRQ